jgi:hypothetical protein
MCDNLGISDKKVKVFLLQTGETLPGRITFTNESECLAWIEGDLENIEEGDEFEYKITISYMTENELENLPEFDG